MYVHIRVGGEAIWASFHFVPFVVSTGQSLARCQEGLASDFGVEHNR